MIHPEMNSTVTVTQSCEVQALHYKMYCKQQYGTINFVYLKD